MVEVERRGERRLLSDCCTVIQTVCEGVKLYGRVPESRWGCSGLLVVLRIRPGRLTLIVKVPGKQTATWLAEISTLSKSARRALRPPVYISIHRPEMLVGLSRCWRVIDGPAV